MDLTEYKAHVLLYKHSSYSVLGLEPASDRRELFRMARCCWIPRLAAFCGKVDVTRFNGSENVPDQIDTHYFVRYVLPAPLAFKLMLYN
jgi:hypothetical protein